MGCIRTVRVLAHILTANHAKIGGRARATILNAFAPHAGFARTTNDAASATILAVCLQIRRLDAVD